MLLKIPIAYFESNEAPIQIMNISFFSNNNETNLNKMFVTQEIEELLLNNQNEEMLYVIIEFLRNKFEFDSSTDNNDEDINITDLQVYDNDSYHNENKKEGKEKNVEDNNIHKNQKNKNNNVKARSELGEIDITIYHSAVITEKKSQFMSHFSYVNNMNEVNEFRDIIICDRKYSRATHNVFAYTFISPDSG